MKSTKAFKCLLVSTLLLIPVISFSREQSREPSREPVSITTDQLKFRYEPNEAESADCKHEQIRDLPDWRVTCESRYHKKEFSVHLVARKYRSPEPIKTKFEVLYWVANRNKAENTNEHTGTTLNFQLFDDVKAREIRIGQMVDKGYADLVLTLKVNP